MFSIFTISVSKQVRGGEGGPSLYPSPVKKLVSTAGLAKSEVLTYHGANYKTTYFEWRKMFFDLSRAQDKEKIRVPIKSRTSDHRIPIKKKHLKTYHLYYSLCKHDATDISDPSSMQYACHMNFVIDLAHSLCVPVAQQWNPRS